MNLAYGFTFEELYTQEGIVRLDGIFLEYLSEIDEILADRLIQGRHTLPFSQAMSALLLDLAPYVEDFLSQLFPIQREVADLQSQAYALAPLYQCKRQFVQRMVAKTFSKEDALQFDEQSLKQALSDLIGQPYTDITFAQAVLKALESEVENKAFLDIAKQYAAWALHQASPSVLFRLPRKLNPEALFPVKRQDQLISSPIRSSEKSYKIPLEKSLDQANYCLLCHQQEKDSCSKGYSESLKGCPLGQKISEMNSLRAQGYTLGALAVIMIDNPMVAATGHRICNDCMKACIFQKQEAVDIPSIETQTLDSVLNLTWGVEIYSLLSRWNPLNLKRPYPLTSTNYKILIAGMGPAGFTLAHYLLNEGHLVVGIDGLKIEPLEENLITKPIQNWNTIKESSDQRIPAGFGGVTEYGITARWDKSYLKLVRLLLQRRSAFSLYDGVRIGGTLTLPQAFELGFDHVALCLGAGQPNSLEIPNALARGVRMASDFLMALQLSDIAQDDSVANLQIRLPILVIGGGLTAVDTATEALTYYPQQVEKFLKRSEKLSDKSPPLSDEETEIADEFINHAHAFQQGQNGILENASTIVYRNKLQESPSYRLNADELNLALQQGVTFLENAIPQEIKVDSYGHIESLCVQTPEGLKDLPCRTLFIATGTHPNKALEQEDPNVKIEGENFLISYHSKEKVSYFGDLHPSYQGNVVKAMASAKEGYPAISESLLKHLPTSSSGFIEKLNYLLEPRIEAVHRLTPSIIEIVVKAPQSAQNFKPGQFFRLQNYGLSPMEGLALTGAGVDLKRGTLTLIALEMGGSSHHCQFLKPGESVALMGPTGTPTEIPFLETVLLIGGGLGNAVLFSIGRALKENNNRVIYVAGYKTPKDRFKEQEIESIADHVIWCCEASPGFTSTRPQDFSFQGNVIEGLLAYANATPPIPIDQVNRIITIGSDLMMAAVSCARKTVLKPYLNLTHKAICSLNSPMQCMMKGICGQCIQTTVNSITGQAQVIFACSAQDQLLDEVDFEILHDRLKQNSLLEKQTKAWVKCQIR